MADRSVHYEAAFEAFLRHRGVPYVAVDEAKKALFSNAKLKSFDFVVYSRTGPNLLIDIKGRQVRARNGSGRRTFETWTDEQDVVDLLQWEQVFGEGFKAVLGFVYWIDPPLAPEPGMFEHRERWYLLMGIDLGGGRFSMLAAQVEPTPAGSRVRLMIDRPAGSAGGADVDDRVLRNVLEEAERSLGRDAAGQEPARRERRDPREVAHAAVAEDAVRQAIEAQELDGAQQGAAETQDEPVREDLLAWFAEWDREFCEALNPAG